MSSLLYLGGTSSPRPPVPDRKTLCTAPWHFQGLRVSLPYFPANTGWFEPALSWIPKEDRPKVYDVKQAAGDKLYGLSYSGAYMEPGQPYEQFVGMDFSKDLPALNAQIDEILPRGYVRLFLAGDGQGSGPGYNDPVGRTYGHDWLMNNFEPLVKSLGDRWRFIQFYPGYDAIFYGWEPDQVVEFGDLFRSLLPDGVLGIEHDIGHIPLGEGDSDYGVGKRMQAYDIVSSEYNGQGGLTQCLVHDDAVWQINGRLRYPSQPYNRPSDQPAWDDPNPPGYMADCPRGEIFHEMMEWATYYDVRGWCTPEGIENDRQYQKAMSPWALCG